MPKCEGRPDGPCPLKKNDKSVHLSQGDLMLCTACETFRFPASAVNTNARAAHTSTTSSSAERQPVDRHVETQPGGRNVAENTATEPAGAASNATTSRRTDSKIVIDELLTYTRYYRDRCTAADLHKQIAHFYLSTEISVSKTTLMNEFQIYLSDSPYMTLRRQTSARPAHEAEIDDILGMLDLLDNLNVLSQIQFVAVSIDRIPRYGPNEINICTVVDRQICVDQELTEIKNILHDETTKYSNQVAQLAAASDRANESLLSRITTLTDKFNGQMQQLEVICSNIHTTISTSANNAAQNRASTITSADGRASNIIAFGVAEDRNRTVWNSTLQQALQHVAGRNVDIADAFRIGKYNVNQSRPRPIVVKLRSVWDRRLVLSNTRKLAEKPEFRRIGFAPDEPVEIRRRNTMKRLHLKAINEGQQASISDDGNGLYIDGDLVFTLRDGFVRNNGNVSNVSNPHNTTNG